LLVRFAPGCRVASTCRVTLHSRSDNGRDSEGVLATLQRGCIVHVRGGAHRCHGLRWKAEFLANNVVVALDPKLREVSVPVMMLRTLAALVVDEVADIVRLSAGAGRGAEYTMRNQQF